MRYLWPLLVICASAHADSKPTPATPAATQSQSAMTGSSTASVGAQRTVALANAAAIPPTCPSGLVPGRGKHRAHGSALYSVSAVCVAPDAEQAAAIEAQRAHEIALARVAVEAARAEAERERAVAERLVALRDVCKAYADRALEVCTAK
jgi:hypothetical protein